MNQETSVAVHSRQSAILHELECFRKMGSVLYIAAHPDDENTELLTYLSRGRDYRTAYLSLTRGDGGQNVLGADLGAKLGVARTQELLAARKLDGAQQFFSRAIDFGFSKNYAETLKVWNKQEVLSDVVRIIRKFKPDVIITRFSPSPGGTHGHHTASTVLALEAFKAAADPKAFPEQKLAPWQAKRIMWNISTFQKDKAVGVNALKIDVGGIDSVSAETFMDIAAKSRAMHKTQGFDAFQFKNVSAGPRLESFQNLDGEQAQNDIMDGVDTTWHRVPGGDKIQQAIDSIIAKFDAKNPAASAPAILDLRTELDSLKSNDSIIAEKRKLLDKILQECIGLTVNAKTVQQNFVPGEAIKIVHTALLRADLPVVWVSTTYPSLNKEEKKHLVLERDKEVSFEAVESIPVSTAFSQPWWLRKEGTSGLFGVEDDELIGSPENTAAFPVVDSFEVLGHRLDIEVEPFNATKVSNAEITRRIDVIPPVSLNFSKEVVLFKPGTTRTVELEMTASRSQSAGSLRLVLPSGWKAIPSKREFRLEKVGDTCKLSFDISSPKKEGTVRILAEASMNGVSYRNHRSEVSYEHLPVQLLQPEASMKAVSTNIAFRGKTVGYIAGAGDSLPENIGEIGYTVKVLDESGLNAQQLEGVDAVVLGVRAFNVKKNIGAAVPILFEYVKNGGTLIVQYNRPDNLKAEKIAPYDLEISAARVTDEKAPITFLAPEHPVLNFPNKITQSDFDGWVQERSIYCPAKYDGHFTAILACNDVGEESVKGNLLIAPYGKGYYMYTGLVFFRELPAGVPGAYKLFANMLSIGK